jgi:hypothetical protein
MGEISVRRVPTNQGIPGVVGLAGGVRLLSKPGVMGVVRL